MVHWIQHKKTEPDPSLVVALGGHKMQTGSREWISIRARIINPPGESYIRLYLANKWPWSPASQVRSIQLD